MNVWQKFKGWIAKKMNFTVETSPAMKEESFLEWLGVKRKNKDVMAEVTYFTCLKMMSETLAKIPWKYYQKTDKGIIEPELSDVDEKRVLQAMKEHPELVQDDWEYMLTGSDFYTELIKYNGILLHSSCVVVDDYAYVFSADSGTGKSTHTQLWLEHFGDRAYILNDDKPAIRLIDGKVYACGTPWSGKYDYSTPKIVELAGICFLQRSETNWIKKAETGKAVFNIFSQTVHKISASRMESLFDVLEQIFAKVPIYDFGCNISDEAVLTSYNAMKPKNKKEVKV